MKEENQKIDLSVLPKEMPPFLPKDGFVRLRQIIGDKINTGNYSGVPVIVAVWSS